MSLCQDTTPSPGGGSGRSCQRSIIWSGKLIQPSSNAINYAANFYAAMATGQSIRSCRLMIAAPGGL